MFGCVVLVVLALLASPLRDRIDGAALDATQRIVRSVAPREAVEDVVIVGIDEETDRRFSEPFALWHKHLGAALAAIAHGNPRLIVVDIVLPEQSYDNLIPGLDAELIRGVNAAKHAGQLIVGLRLDAQGRPQRIEDLLLAAVGRDAIGLAYVSVDRDGVARRIDAPRSEGGARAPLLADRIAGALGLKPRAGIIDFACGKPFTYLPMHDVVTLGRDHPSELAAAFSGKIVLLGTVGPDEDPVRQPLSVASWDPATRTPPGVVLIAQTARALESGRILGELPGAAVALLVALGAAVVFVGGAWNTWIAAALTSVLLLVAGYIAYLAGLFVPPAGPLAAIVLGATVRSTFEAFEHRRFRRTIERQFAGYVSENLLQAILAGEVDPRQPRKYANLGFLFADIRGFTTMVEKSPPGEVLALLNRYYEAITPAIHMFDGTIDNFRGDGILAIFGAPRAVPDGPRRAGLAARDIFVRLETLNTELVREGHIPLDIGIGLAAGDGVAGNVGTTSRYGYSAVGDAVNVSARLQSHCKPLKMKIIATESIARACVQDLPFVPLGRLELSGHAALEAFGVPKSRDFLLSETLQKSLGHSDSFA